MEPRALREQVGRLERKRCSLPKDQRGSESPDLQQFQIRTPQGVYVPLGQVADFRSSTNFYFREDGRRKVNVKQNYPQELPSAQNKCDLNKTDEFKANIQIWIFH